MTFMIQRLKKTTYMTVTSSQKLSEIRHYNVYVMELREKWVSFYDANYRRITNKCQNCHVSVCSKFSQICFCHIYLNWFTVGKVITKIKG